MQSDGLIEATGETRARRYHLVPTSVVDFEVPITPDLREDAIWRQRVAPILEDLPQNVLVICQHGFTEILNNAIDHSGSATAKIHVVRNAARIELTVLDEGIGIFEKIQSEKNLDDSQEAIFELSKGRLTTDPANHSGEGIFFTSRMFDKFMIMSDHSSLICTPEHGDWLWDLVDANIAVKTVPTKVEGTCVLMVISAFSTRTIAEVMNKFAGENHDYSFSKTHVPVRLARYDNAELISRSQAKRLMARLYRFKEVVLDFVGIETIGQGFADQIFRVYRKEHPGVHITWVRATELVQGMIRRAEEGEMAEGGIESRIVQPSLPGIETTSGDDDPDEPGRPLGLSSVEI